MVHRLKMVVAWAIVLTMLAFPRICTTVFNKPLKMNATQGWAYAVMLAMFVAIAIKFLVGWINNRPSAPP